MYAEKERFVKLDTEYRRVSAEVAAKEKDYERLFEEIMALEEQLG